ncbi:MAG: hypothetical protein NT013_07475 [Planctomycetia bacterium]|nr:hypothetical protein [Planctomycetia bacterium]
MHRLPHCGRWIVRGLLLALLVFLSGSPVRASHRHHVTVYGGVYGPGYFVHPHCVTNWYGPPAYPMMGVGVVATSGGYYGGYSNFGYSSYSPYFGPTVIRQTTIVPVSPTVIVTGVAPVPIRSTRRVLPPPPPGGANMQDVLQLHAERYEGSPSEVDVASTFRPVSASSRTGKERSRQFQTEGDRLLHDGQFVKGYLRYLEAQREAEDRSDVYFRQAFALVAMGRYPHAVMKMKRGLQVDPTWPKSAVSLDTVYGIENVVHKTEYLQRVADWADANVRDADRLFLVGVMLYCDEDPRATEFFRSASKLSDGQGAHLHAFLKSTDRLPQPPREVVVEKRGSLQPPPPPEDDLVGGEIEPRPVTKELRLNPLPQLPQHIGGPRLPALDTPPNIPPEPARRELILPDVLDAEGEYVP